jgi:hypothetical protein
MSPQIFKNKISSQKIFLWVTLIAFLNIFTSFRSPNSNLKDELDIDKFAKDSCQILFTNYLYYQREAKSYKEKFQEEQKLDLDYSINVLKSLKKKDPRRADYLSFVAYLTYDLGIDTSTQTYLNTMKEVYSLDSTSFRYFELNCLHYGENYDYHQSAEYAKRYLYGSFSKKKLPESLYTSLASSYCGLKHFDLAIKIYDSVLDKYQNEKIWQLGNLYYNKANAYANLGGYDSAMIYAFKAIEDPEINQTLSHAYELIAWLYFEQGDIRSAFKFFKNSMRYNISSFHFLSLAVFAQALKCDFAERLFMKKFYEAEPEYRIDGIKKIEYRIAKRGVTHLPKKLGAIKIVLERNQ